MGMDTLPSETKPMIHEKEQKDKKTVNNESYKVASTHNASLISKSMKQNSKEILPCVEQNSSQHTKSHLSSKPQLREHPQQDLLQIFKKDFEAWQASKAWENARTLGLEYELLNACKSRNGSESSLQNFSDIKDVGYMDAKESSFVTGPRNYVSSTKQKTDAKIENLLKSEGWISRDNKHITRKGSRLKDREMSNSILLSTEGKGQKSSSSQRIVIIQPSIEMNDDTETSWLPSSSWLSSPERAGQEINTQQFLEEVKKKLEFEVQGKNKFNSETRWNKKGTFFNQISSDLKKVKENGIKDYTPTLVRSTSNSFTGGEIQLNVLKFPQLINESTRKFLSERLRIGLKDVQLSLTVDGSTLCAKEKMMFKPTHCFTKKGKARFCKENEVTEENKIGSFLCDDCHDLSSGSEKVPFRKLVRSLSAPMATTAFGYLESEDKHEKIGARINGKCEASENELVEARKVRKDSFNIKSRVSCLKQNLITKGKFFGKKMQLIDETTTDETSFLKTTMTLSSAIVDSGFSQDNLTEVPPSPVSVCSSSYDFCKAGYPSPVSPLEAPFAEELNSSQVSGELTSKLPDYDQADIFKDEETEEGVSKPMHVYNETLEAEDTIKSFIQEVLLTSRLFDRLPFNHLFVGWDSLTKPIPKWVFDKVEEKYTNSKRSEARTSLSLSDHVQVSRRMLFDLLNEGLLKIAQTSVAGSTLTEWYFGPGRMALGEKLSDNIWNQIQVFSKPPADGLYTLNYIVDWDLKRTPWSAASQDGICEMGMEIEFLILRDLIDEFVLDFKP